jgi:hypothetical protein
LPKISKPGYAVARGGFMTVQIEVKEETAIRLQAIAQALRLSLDDYLAKVAEIVSVPQPNGGAIQPEVPQPQNEAMLDVLARSAERMKDVPVSGTTEDSLKIIREGRAGRTSGENIWI